MGFQMIVLDPTLNSPAGQVADRQIVAAFDQISALTELAELCDVITYEFENIEVASLEKAIPLEKLPQGTGLLKITQNRLLEKCFFNRLAVRLLCGSEKSERAATSNRKDWFSMCLKTIQGGYDGKGQVVLKCEEDFSQATELLANATCELEKWVPFTKELSIIVAGISMVTKAFLYLKTFIERISCMNQLCPLEFLENVQQKQRNWRNTLLRN